MQNKETALCFQLWLYPLWPHAVEQVTEVLCWSVYSNPMLLRNPVCKTQHGSDLAGGGGRDAKGDTLLLCLLSCPHPAPMNAQGCAEQTVGNTGLVSS